MAADTDRLGVNGARTCVELREAIRHNKAELLAIAKGDHSLLSIPSRTP